MRFLIAFMVCATSALPQTPEFNWANTYGTGSTYTEANHLAVDPSGNVFTSGIFSGTTDFDPGPSTFTLNSGTAPYYLIKSSATGALLWAKQLEASAISSMASDSKGNLLMAGSALQGHDIDPGPGSLILSKASGYLVKLDPQGSLLWARTDSTVHYFSVAVDQSDHLYTCGTYVTGYDFDKGPATYTLVAPPQNQRYFFTMKLDSTGSLVWASAAGSEPQVSQLSSITADKNGNALVCGYFGGQITFDPGQSDQNFSSAGANDLFVVKTDSIGQFVFVKVIGGTGTEMASTITTDNNRNILVAGDFNGTLDFDPGPGSTPVTSPTTGTGFVLKLDPGGNFAWARTCPQNIGTSNTDKLLFADAFNNVFAFATFSGQDSLISDSTIHVSAHGSRDALVVKFDSSGTALWAGVLGGLFVESAYALAAGPAGQFFVAGSFASDDADFDPGPSTSTAAAGSAIVSAFVVAFDQPCVNTLTIAMIDAFLCEGDSVQLSAMGQGTVQWYYEGQLVGTGNDYFTPPLDSGYHAYVVKDKTSFCSGGAGVSYGLSVDNCTDISEHGAKSGIKVYPNPGSGLYVIESTVAIGLISVTDLLGKIVMATSVHGNISSIDLRHQPSGVYFLQYQERGTVTRCARLIKY